MIARLLSKLQEKGIHIALHHDKLRLHADRGVLTEDIKAEIKEHKAELIQHLAKKSGKATQQVSNSGNSREENYLPLLYTQKGFWLQEKLGAAQANVISACFELHGELDTQRFKNSCTQVFNEQPLCKSYINVIDGEPVMRINPEVELPFAYCDLSAASSATVQNYLDDCSIHYFILSKAPLVKISLAKLNLDRWHVAFHIHHIIADDHTVKLFFKQVQHCYVQSLLQGGESRSIKKQQRLNAYSSWVRNQYEYLSDPRFMPQIETRLKQFIHKDIFTTLPIAQRLQDKNDFVGSREQLNLGAGLTAQLNQEASQLQVTPYIYLLSVFSLLLSHYNHREQQYIGTAISMRQESELQSLVGCLINFIVLVANTDSSFPFKQHLQQIKQAVLEGFEHARIPHEFIVEQIATQTEGNTRCNIAFIYECNEQSSSKFHTSDIVELERHRRSSKLELVLLAVHREGELHLIFEYSSNRFQPSDIQTMLQRLQILLKSALSNPQQTCDRLDWQSPEEQKRVYQSLYGGPAYPDAAITTLFSEQVSRTPGHIAIKDKHTTLCYAELETISSQLARYFLQQGITEQQKIGLCMNKSVGLVVCILALWKIRVCYLPLDINYPAQRLKFICTDSGIEQVLTEKALVKEVTTFAQGLQQLVIDEDTVQIVVKQQETDLPEQKPEPQDIANLIYTSGTTNHPKGVLVSHRGLTNMARGQIQLFKVDDSSCVLQFSSVCFDASVSEILMALLSGASLYLPQKEEAQPGLPLFDLLHSQSISVVTLPPVVLSSLPQKPVLHLKTLIVAGESCPPQLVAFWSRQRSFFNAYGPTENSVCATVESDATQAAKSSIGKAIPGVTVWLLDDNLQPVPAGIVGEIYLSGAGVSLGYLNRIEQNARHFIKAPSPHLVGGAQQKDSVFYKTGDLACLDNEGRLIFKGRKDNQLKIRGHRVETEEIQHCINEVDLVDDSLVLGHSQQTNNDCLIAFVASAKAAQEQTESNLRHAITQNLRDKLPAFMQVSHISIFENFPVTPGGKVDRAALRQQEKNRRMQAESNVDASHLDPISAKVYGIFQHLLLETDFTVQDSFFDLGGHSMLAVKLASQIEVQCQANVTLTDIVQHPSIRQLAKLIKLKQSPSPLKQASARSPIVSLSKNTTDTQLPSLYLVHPIGGTVLGYQPLAKQLTDQVIINALQAPGVENQEKILDSIPQLAKHHLQAILSEHSHYPQYLGGHSFGGLVAFEMAQQLAHMGSPVKRLILIDTPAPVDKNRPRSIESDKDWLLRRLLAVQAFVGKPLLADENSFTQMTAEQQIDVFIRLMREFDFLPQNASQDMVTRLIAVQKASHKAIVDYQASFYRHPLYLLKARQRPEEQAREEVNLHFSDELLDWGTYCMPEHITMEHGPGNHFTLLREPNVKSSANILLHWLTRASG